MSVPGRIGSLTFVTDTLRDVGLTQTRLSELQKQISSGFKSSNFEGLNGSIEQFTQLSSQISRATQFQTNNQINIAKLQTADVALSKVTDIADRMKNIIIGANSATIRTSNIPQLVNDLLTSLGRELNTTFGGNYIFGGTDTMNAPVPDTSISNNALGLPDSNYYTGSKQDAVMRADDRTDVVFPVRADNIAFQKIYAAAKQAIEAASSGDTGLMQQAQQLIISGQADLISVRSRAGATVNNIETVNDQLTVLRNYWKGLADSISRTDIVAASTQVSSYQAILQASFQVYSRLSQLRLSDYLK